MSNEIECEVVADATRAQASQPMEELRRGILNIALKLGSGVDRNSRPYHWMLDCRELLLTGSYLQLAVREIWRRIKPYQPDFVAGMTLAANPLAIALMLESCSDHCSVDALLIRREPKADGLRKRIEGPQVWPGARIVLLDDIVNSGETQRQALEALAQFHANVIAVATLVDFERAGSQLLVARHIPLIALFTLKELGIATQREQSPGRLHWQWKAGPISVQRNGVVKSAPCVSDKTIFIGSDTGFLAAFSLEGEALWRFMVRDNERGVHSSPAVFGDWVVFGAYDGYLYCVNRISGELRWESRIGQWIGLSPAIVASQGIICVGVESGEAGGALVAVEAESGAVRWRFATRQYVHGSPFFDEPREQLIFGANDFTLYCVDLDGRQRWQFITDGEIKARPVVDSDGRCFFGSFDGNVYALDANDGKLLWKRRAGTSVYFTPLLARDLVIFGSDSYRLIACCRTSGTVRWVGTTGSAIRGGAVEIDSQYVAFGSKDGFLYLLDLETCGCVDRFQTGDEIVIAPAYADGQLFISSLDGYLYAFSIGVLLPKAGEGARSSGSSEAGADNALCHPMLKHFRLMKNDVDVAPLREELAINETLWLANTNRQSNVKVQRETNNILLRRADLDRNPGKTSTMFTTASPPRAPPSSRES
jgi:outer membrane protein assembly factor BamB